MHEIVGSSETIQCQWNLLSIDIDDDEHADELLQEICNIWLSIRGHSMTRKWMEEYKISRKKGTKRSRALRKQLKKDEEKEEKGKGKKKKAIQIQKKTKWKRIHVWKRQEQRKRREKEKKKKITKQARAAATATEDDTLMEEEEREETEVMEDTEMDDDWPDECSDYYFLSLLDAYITDEQTSK